GDLVVTVIEPGVAMVHRIRHKALFENSLSKLIPFAEELCGWVISKQGIEIRYSDSQKVAEDNAVDTNEWLEFQNWFFSAAGVKPSFPGVSVLSPMRSEVLLGSGNNSLAFMVLMREPTNAEAFMLLAEGAVSTSREQIGTIANFIGAASMNELLAAADLWSELAVRLTNHAPEYAARRKNVLSAIAQ